MKNKIIYLQPITWDYSYISFEENEEEYNIKDDDDQIPSYNINSISKY